MGNEENEGAPAQGVTEDEEGLAQDVTEDAADEEGSSQDMTEDENTQWVHDLCRGEVVSKVPCIPENDTFDLTQEFLSTTTPENELSECFTSHGFMRFHSDDKVSTVFKSCMFQVHCKDASGKKCLAVPSSI